MSTDAYEQMIRADRAELALADVERKLARVLQMADTWEAEWGDRGIKASMAAAVLRRTIRGLEFSP